MSSSRLISDKRGGARASDFEALLAFERQILEVPLALRQRTLERAVSSLRHGAAVRLQVALPNPRRPSVGLLAAEVVTLTALCVAAFTAGHKAREMKRGAYLPRSAAPATAATPSQEVKDSHCVGARERIAPGEPSTEGQSCEPVQK